MIANMIVTLPVFVVLSSSFRLLVRGQTEPYQTDRLLCAPRPVEGLSSLVHDKFSGDWKEILKTPGPPNVALPSSGVWRIDFTRNTFSYAAPIENSPTCISPIVGTISEEYSADNILLEYDYFGHRIKEKLRVVATDYTSYAILYVCAWSVPHLEVCAPEATHVTVLARHGLDDVTSRRILTELRNICVKKSMLVAQDNNVTCPLDPPVTVSEGGSDVPGTTRCFKDKDPGYCQSKIQAFYYNSRTHKCEEHTYTGCGGNANNFFKESECIEECQRPLEDAARTKASTRAPSMCNSSCGLTCPSCCVMQDDNCITCDCQRTEHQSWLVPAPCVQSSTDCPPKCQAHEKSSGCFDCSCTVKDGSLQPAVEYKAADTTFRCPPTCQLTGTKCHCVSHDVCNLPLVESDCDSNEPKYFYNVTASRCEVFKGCNGNENSFESHEACLERCSDICHFPKDTGPCTDKKEERYFYNPQTGQCEAMVYGGCGGNENNFKSMQDCKQRCQEACTQEPDAGPCDANLIRFYYDKNDNLCRHFAFGGCQGNGNNFYTEEQCNRRCKGPTEQTDDESIDRPLCHLPLDEGKCDNEVRPETRYFYNAEKQECQSFVFAGCGGNDNNFKQLPACNKTCYGSTIQAATAKPSASCPQIKCSCDRRKEGRQGCLACDCAGGSGAHRPSALGVSGTLLIMTIMHLLHR